MTWVDDYRKRFPPLYPTVAEERRAAELREKYRIEIDRYFKRKTVTTPTPPSPVHDGSGGES